MAQYYVIRNKNTGLYFRGKGVNRWGKHYNQASIYRVKGSAEHTIEEISWRGEQAEIVPIQIVETTEDVVPKSKYDRLEKLFKDMTQEAKGYLNRLYGIRADVAREIFEEIERFLYLHFRFFKEEIGNDDTEYVKGRLEHNTQMQDLIAELKKKYTEGNNGNEQK